MLKCLTLACSGAMLLACSSVAPPQMRSDPNEAYLLGRSAHLALRFDQAARAYQAALAAAPGHTNARNGLAALYAEQGMLARAIGLWEPMLADTEPSREQSWLYANLGQAYFLNGDFDKARGALEKACYLDPLNYRAWHKLGNTLERLGQREQAGAMQRQAESLRTHDLAADQQLARAAGKPWARTELQQDARGVFVLHRVAPAPIAQLEIRNGNGVRGMARQLARSMRDDSTEVVRLTNERGFGVLHTRVEYQPAFRQAAERLAERIGVVQMVQVADVARADLRLVIGHDLAGARAYPVYLAGRD